MQGGLRVLRDAGRGRGPEHVARLPHAVRFRCATEGAPGVQANLSHLLRDADDRRRRRAAEVVRPQGQLDAAPIP